MAELGIISAKGRNGTAELLKIIATENDDSIPAAARLSLDVLARQYVAIAAEIGDIEKHIHAWHRSCAESRRLEEIPDVGLIVATAPVAEVGYRKTFSCGRNLAAWIGLVPKQHSTGGKERLGGISKQPIFATAARCGRNGCRPIRASAQHEAALARAYHEPPANRSRFRRAGQQDRTYGLGHDGARRAVQGTKITAGSGLAERKQKA
jgi:transposase